MNRSNRTRRMAAAAIVAAHVLAVVRVGDAQAATGDADAAQRAASGPARTVEYSTTSTGLALHVAGDSEDGVSFFPAQAAQSEGYVKVCAASGCRAQFAPGKYKFRVFYADGVTSKAGVTNMESYTMISVSDPRIVEVDRDVRLHAVYRKHETMRFMAFMTGLTLPVVGVMWGVIGLLVHKPVHAAIGGSLVVVGVGGAYLLNVPDTMQLNVEGAPTDGSRP
jgi:hypothetical protein